MNIAVGPGSPVRALGQWPVVTIPADATLGDAARAMRRADVSAALLEHRQGIVTERDLATALAHDLGPTDPVHAVAVTDPVVVRDHATVLEIAELMVAQHVRHVIVETAHGEIESVVSIRDVVGILLQATDPALTVFLQRVVTEHAEIWLG